MKKILTIIFISILFSSNSSANNLSDQDKKLSLKTKKKFIDNQ